MKGKNQQAAVYLFTKRLYSDSKYDFNENNPNAPRGRTAYVEKRLEKLLKKYILTSNKIYTFDELSEIISHDFFKPRRNLAIASIVFTFSLFLMDAFHFVRISENKISYSALNSFDIQTVDVDEVTDVKLFCKKKKTRSSRGRMIIPTPLRDLVFSVELNNEYKFIVDSRGFKNMATIWSDFDINSSQIVFARQECKKPKYNRKGLQKYLELKMP